MNVRTVALLVAALVVVTGLLVGVGLAGAGGYLWHDHNRAVETAVQRNRSVDGSCSRLSARRVRVVSRGVPA